MGKPYANVQYKKRQLIYCWQVSAYQVLLQPSPCCPVLVQLLHHACSWVLLPSCLPLILLGSPILVQSTRSHPAVVNLSILGCSRWCPHVLHSLICIAAGAIPILAKLPYMTVGGPVCWREGQRSNDGHETIRGRMHYC
jgi:hypothetical protein